MAVDPKVFAADPKAELINPVSHDMPYTSPIGLSSFSADEKDSNMNIKSVHNRIFEHDIEILDALLPISSINL